MERIQPGIVVAYQGQEQRKKEDQGKIGMGIILMGIRNIVIFKPSFSSSFSARAASKDAYIDIWERRG